MAVSQRRRRVGFVLLLSLWALLAAAAWGIKQPVFGKDVRFPPPAVDAARLERHVRMLSETLAPRSYGDENLDKVADYIAQSFREAGLEVREQRFRASGRDGEFRNIIARVGPATGKPIVVGAHYDAWGGLPGADDNASGVAGVIELAGMLARTPPKVPVELVAWPNEEPPHFATDEMGSAQHAAALTSGGKGAGVRLMISLEMIGCFSDEPGSQSFPLAPLKLLYSDKGNYIAVVGRVGEGWLTRKMKRVMRSATDLGVETINAPRAVPGVDLSDHRSFWDRDVPAVMITDTAFFRNPRYHTAEDTWDTLDYVRMGKVVQGVYSAVHALAEDAED